MLQSACMVFTQGKRKHACANSYTWMFIAASCISQNHGRKCSSTGKKIRSLEITHSGITFRNKKRTNFRYSNNMDEPPWFTPKETRLKRLRMEWCIQRMICKMQRLSEPGSEKRNWLWKGMKYFDRGDDVAVECFDHRDGSVTVRSLCWEYV